MSEYTEEPIYQEFHVEDRYVVKQALATAYVKVTTPELTDNDLFFREIMSDETVSDTSEEANPATGKRGKALDLPSDQQMKRVVARKLTAELVRQVQEGFLQSVGLESYAIGKFAEANGDAEEFGENAIRFLLSPAARAHPEQAHDIYLLLEGLVQRATRTERDIRVAEFANR